MPGQRVFATECRYSGSQISGWPERECTTCGFSSRKLCFHFLKFSGSWLQVSSLMTYFSIWLLLSISLMMELGLRSVIEMIMPVCTPQKSKVRRSSSIGVTISPFLFLRVSLMQGGSDPQRFQMFSLRARMVDCGSNLSSGMRSEERLCQRSTLIMNLLLFVG